MQVTNNTANKLIDSNAREISLTFELDLIGIKSLDLTNVVTPRKVGTCQTRRTLCLSTSVALSGCGHDLTRVMRKHI